MESKLSTLRAHQERPSQNLSCRLPTAPPSPGISHLETSQLALRYSSPEADSCKNLVNQERTSSESLLLTMCLHEAER